MKNTGGGAFPSHGSMGEVSNEGMTLRDYFAAKDMESLIPWYADHNNGIGTDHISRNVPVLAYQMADGMLKARES
ncbi:MAG: hypothetical protein WAW75_04925 [Gallionella sp.]